MFEFKLLTRVGSAPEADDLSLSRSGRGLDGPPPLIPDSGPLAVVTHTTPPPKKKLIQLALLAIKYFLNQ